MSNSVTDSGNLWLVILSKSLRSFGTFVLYDLLKSLHVSFVLWIVYLSSSLCLAGIQKPFSSSLSGRQWFAVFRQAVFHLGLDIAWFYGLTFCGPLRTVLISDHSSMAVAAAATAAISLTGTGSNIPTKTRGMFLFLAATLALLLVDHDDNSAHHQAHHTGHAGHHMGIYSYIRHVFSWTEISDHKGGVLLLTAVLFLRSVETWSSRRTAVIIGGNKRLTALISIISTALLTPWVAYHYLTESTKTPMTTTIPFYLLIVTFTLKLLDFYAEMSVSKKYDTSRMSRWKTMTSIVSAFVLASIWIQPISLGREFPDMEDHQMSPGVIFAAILFCFATLNLTSSGSTGTRGVFVGYSAAGLPLYNLTSGSIHDAGQSIVRIAKQGLQQILEDSNSRRIFYFLLLNLFFTAVEFTYGIWTNSLGLISDGFHMLFDCSALVMGLYASVMSRWKPSKAFSYGYGRLEVLSGFVNGLFLAVISLNVFVAGLGRLFDPPNVGTDKLFVVSVGGLLINLVGIFAFSHGSEHGHSHGGGGGGGSHGHSHGHNANMQGVFLHILADTLGSVGVIISSLLIEYYGLFIADPICSIFISVLIFASVVPLLKQSSEVLLLTMPPEIEEDIHRTLNKLTLEVEGVLGHRAAQFWPHTSEKIYGTVCIKVQQSADVQSIIEAISHKLQDSGVNFPVVQVEKEDFYYHLQGLGSKFAL